MKTYAELEAEYLALCESVRQDALRIYGLAGVGRSDDAAIAAATLAQSALTRKNQYKMAQERAAAGAYDLAALRVDVTSGSNSETGWERED